MKIPPKTFCIKIMPLVASALMLGAVNIQASVVYNENFTGETSPDSAFELTTASGVSYSVSTTLGNPASSLLLSDTSSSNGGLAKVTGTNWSSFNTASAGQETFQVSFDWNITSMTSSVGSTSTMRFNLSLATGATTASTISIGFGHASIGGTDTNFFFAQGAGTSPTPSASNAIGWNGSSWASGFNFGAYSATSTDNDTGGYYHFVITYDNNATIAGIQITNASDSLQTTSFAVSGLTSTSVANTSGRSLQFIAPGTGQGEAYFDNIVVETIPEPGSTVFLLVGLSAFGLAAVSRKPGFGSVRRLQ